MLVSPQSTKAFGMNEVTRSQVKNPYVFIVGCPRSGTTLLQRMVDAHPQIAITPESHWIPRLSEKRWALTRDGMVTRKLIRRLLAHPKFARLGISREQLRKLGLKGGPVSYSRLVTGIFDLYGEAQGKPLVGDKTPDYIRRIDTLHRLWPEARFVHVIRDGRDVCRSMMEWPKVHPKPGDFVTWREDPVSTAAWWWRLNVHLGRQAGRPLGPERYYELRYESLVARPRQECEALLAFLKLRYDDDVLRFYEDRHRRDPGLEAKRAGLPVTAGLRKWRSEMSADDVERFEAAAGDLLDELNYPRAVPRPQAEALEHASRIRDLLARDPGTRDHSRCDPEST
ncbi:MAG TPA: sulfotransferase [Terriglobales bacterium]|nr:sulfotransferase [Terriglobales bacterium]